MKASFVPLRLLGALFALALLASLPAHAQSPDDPPIPPPLDDEEVAPDDASDAEAAEAPTTDPYAGQVGAGQEGSGSGDPTEGPYDADPYAASVPAAAGEAGAPASPPPEEEEFERWARRQSLREGNTLSGSTGTHRVRGAGSGAQGTFRFNMLGGFNGMSGFLCTPNHPCPLEDGSGFLTDAPDSSQRIDAIATLSVTPLPFLEAFAGIRNSATSNSAGTPELLQIVGDWNLGVKGFLPKKADRIFTFGGEAELLLLTGTGGVGLDGAATSFAMRALATADFSYRTEKKKRLPMRFNANLGYFFDNSGAVVSGLENTPPPEGRGDPIERTERYGLGVSRVDSLEIGLSAEYLNEWVHPFVEWTIDVPANRQGYVCNVQSAASRGDLCLGDYAGLQTSPSRLTIGARGYPWQETGLTATLAVDIGTGATGFFLEEVAPEAPYTVWVGLGYAVDVSPLPERTAPVDATPAAARAPAHYVLGQVKDEKSEAVIPDAILRYADGAHTGMVADAEGRFTTTDLAPGEYSFTLFADGYKEGKCSVIVPDTAPEAVGPAIEDPALRQVDDPYAPETAASGASAEPAVGDLDSPPAPLAAPDGDAPYVDANGDVNVPLTCKMKPLPEVSTISGLLVDQDTGAPVRDSTITITDKLERRLELAVDERGAFQFRNVPFGLARLTVRAPGYLPTVREVKVESRKDIEAHLVMNKRPERSSIVVSQKALVLRKPITFIGETVEVAADSMVVVEEVALLLVENEDIGQIEVQVHTDDSGAASYSRRLSQERADKLMSHLRQLGVPEYRLTAKGYGPDQPLAPNVTDENRKKNNRVEFVITKKGD